MPHPPTRPTASAAAAVLLALTACGTSGQDRATDAATDLTTTDPAVDELAAQDGRPCPGRLPGGGAASGGSDPAPGAPDLPEPDRAWVCTYVLRSGPAATPADTAWARDARPREVDADRLPELAAALSGLAPADGRLCTKELGPRYLLVLATDGGAGTDLTGVAVDGFGCRDVRLTDDPFTTPPGETSGEASAPGVVPGVLSAPDDLLPLLTSGGVPAGR